MTSPEIQPSDAADLFRLLALLGAAPSHHCEPLGQRLGRDPWWVAVAVNHLHAKGLIHFRSNY